MINFGRTNTNQLALWWRNIDKLLFILIISLMLLGIFFAYTSTSSIASEKIYKTDYFLIAKHILFASISFLIVLIGCKANREILHFRFYNHLFFIVISFNIWS
jgi:cell division protein FtsW (lipid II flippase)